jgi:hypothetical protein
MGKQSASVGICSFLGLPERQLGNGKEINMLSVSESVSH